MMVVKSAVQEFYMENNPLCSPLCSCLFLYQTGKAMGEVRGEQIQLQETNKGGLYIILQKEPCLLAVTNQRKALFIYLFLNTRGCNVQI